jgi:hypothetical protein
MQLSNILGPGNIGFATVDSPKRPVQKRSKEDPVKQRRVFEKM